MEASQEATAMFKSQNCTTKTSHRMFRHIYGVLNKIYLQNFLQEWVVNREMDLMNLLNPWYATVML